MFDNPVLKVLMDKYGHIDDVEQLKAALTKDGFGDLVELTQNSEWYDSFIEENREEINQSLKNYTGSGVMPAQENVLGLQLAESDNFQFDQQACLSRCNGKCCKGRNYLMIVYSDIFKILNSPVASYLNINSTIDLFDHNPPYIELFLNESYNMYLPYLRYLSPGNDLDIPPEHSENSVCPFLYPIEEIYTFYDLNIPQYTSKNAMGCILMENKPLVCKLSPVSQSRGMETGRISYKFIQPTKDCPGFNTHKEIQLSSYLKDLMISHKDNDRSLFHEMVMKHHERIEIGVDQKRFNSILLEFYNIDRLLSLNGQRPEKRPKYRHLMKILIDAAKGDFSLYDRFIKRLSNSSELEEDKLAILFNIENVIVQIYRQNKMLTDRIVTNTLNALICDKEDRFFQIDYMRSDDEKLHKAIFDQISSSLLRSQESKRIIINALKQVLSSVKKFSKKSKSKTSYLDFVIGYFP